MQNDLFTVAEGSLKLRRNPDLTEINGVKAEMVRLLEADSEGAELDLTQIEGITSTTVGMTVAVHLRAAESGRKLTVTIREQQKRLFDLTMLTNTLCIKVADRGDE
ncbi:MAG: STAS domain-containing protein [Planctomycetota bacterium]|jgi:hypothetical protein